MPSTATTEQILLQGNIERNDIWGEFCSTVLLTHRYTITTKYELRHVATQWRFMVSTTCVQNYHSLNNNYISDLYGNMYERYHFTNYRNRTRPLSDYNNEFNKRIMLLSLLNSKKIVSSEGTATSTKKIEQPNLD